MSHSEDAEQMGNVVDSDVATDDQQGGSYAVTQHRRVNEIIDHSSSVRSYSERKLQSAHTRGCQDMDKLR